MYCAVLKIFLRFGYKNLFRFFKILIMILEDQAQRIALKLGFDPEKKLFKDAYSQIQKLYKMFMRLDCTQVIVFLYLLMYILKNLFYNNLDFEEIYLVMDNL